MTEVFVRFVVGGTLVAVLPLVSERVGPAVAGALLLLPAVSLAGLVFIGRDQGLHVVADTSIAAILGLPAVLAFLLGVHYSARYGSSLALAIALGTACWVSVATPIVLISGGNLRS
jgi:uncharacterized membrane protein (GlpM family)